MAVEIVEADYLLIGSGAMGMAFADVLIRESEATLAIVDRRGKPGGHWNDAYPFVRLHQPSAFYGVGSRPLGSGRIDRAGWNAGLYELASGAEVLGYFDQVLREELLPSGRVRYFPMCHYQGDGVFTSLLSGETYWVDVRRKVVDGTYMNVTVPATRAPAYTVDPGVSCVPPNALTQLRHAPAGYVVVGGGKTGIDTCLWLLERHVDPDRITWIVPHDAWLLDRAALQPPGAPGGKPAAGALLPFDAILGATSTRGLFETLESQGALLRIDPEVWPSRYRCATVAQAELRELRRIRHVVRLGRVRRIGRICIELDSGTLPTTPDHLHVDCSANGAEPRPPVPVFSADAITLQSIRTCQQVFSAALIAHLEVAIGGEAEKNALSAPVPHPYSDSDWLRVTLANVESTLRWAQCPEIAAWVAESRLDLSGRVGLVPDTSSMSSAEAAHWGKALTEVVARLRALLRTAEPHVRPGEAGAHSRLSR